MNQGSDAVPLTSGKRVTGSIPAALPNSCILSEKQYTIEVPADAARLAIFVSEVGDSANIDLYVRFGKRVELREGKIVADFKETGEFALEGFELSIPGPSPREGAYFIAVANCGGAPSHFILGATVTEAFEPDAIEIRDFREITGTVPAPPPGACALQRTQYAIELPDPGPCGPFFDFTIRLRSDQNVKLYARLGSRVTEENGAIVSDKESELMSGFQVIRLTNFDSLDVPADRPGFYYLAVSNCGPGPASFTLRAASPFIDLASFFVSEIFVRGNSLHVAGCGFTFDDVIVINGKPQKTIFGVDELVAKGAAKRIAPGETVGIVLRTRFGRRGPHTFTRPPE